ncbi:MAG: Veg family protein [Christensenellales bacterium]
MKNALSLTDIKSKINQLKGQNIALEINKGRNKIVSLTAIIDQVYPSMFVISPTSEVSLDRKSYSYSDVLCGDVRFVEE